MNQAPLHVGLLKKEGLKNKNWKKRLFVLQRDFLFYFAPDKVPTGKGACVLKGCSVDKVEKKSRPYCVAIAMGGEEPMVVRIMQDYHVLPRPLLVRFLSPSLSPSLSLSLLPG
eukprot:TRINITY_DN13969_c0_g3_i1.p1 TRINITY_DN13969_c0_g3~~TRINITY_DN13969_c0_g3_i1.p1  ORF type:complete len:113 (+),score=18.54 TRINITY_DN13969_c0_g3_i1:233-571(+)